MAVYFLNLKTFGRSNGGSAPSAAAYRAGERIRDERTGRTYDHTDRQDVMHKEILVPSEYAGVDMGWAQDRANLWNAAEAAESRENARVAREYLVALPSELDGRSRVGLARDFAQELADRYRFAVDVAVHAPRDFPGSDPRNFHAHLLATTREIDRHGLGSKTAVELSDRSRRALGFGPAVDELLHVRARWAAVTNEALRNASVEARVDHRSLRAQGIEREPRPWIPRVAYEIERRGFYSPVAERVRGELKAWEQAQSERGRQAQSEQGRQARFERGRDTPQRDHEAGPPEAARTAPPARPSPPAPAVRPSLADMQRQARENWLRVRQELAERPAENTGSRGRDDDLSR